MPIKELTEDDAYPLERIETKLMADFHDYLTMASEQFGIEGYKVIARHMRDMAGEFAEMARARLFPNDRVSTGRFISPPEADE
jgi:hypothetical protein